MQPPPSRLGDHPSREMKSSSYSGDGESGKNSSDHSFSSHRRNRNSSHSSYFQLTTC